MTLYICEICLKTFKTNQHLNQHKNRKKKCKGCFENLNNFIIPITNTNTNSIVNNDASKNGLIPNFQCSPSSISCIPQSSNTSNILNENNNYLLDSNMNINKKDLQNLSKTSPNYMFQDEKLEYNVTDNSPQNITVSSFIDYLIKYQKIIEETKNLESTIIQLKNEVNELTVENIDLKRKINVVENFITFFKKANKNSSDKKIDDIN